MKHNGDVVFEKEGCIAYISINKASSMNAIDADLAEAIGKVIKEVGRDPAIKVVIISGSGGKAFCAGADIKYLSTLKDGVEARRFSEEMHDLFNSIEVLEKIVIAAIEGYCLGGGCELAMACDLRIAGSSSVFGQPEVKLGLVPGGGGTYRLQQIVGVGNAKELIFSGRSISAEEALRIGLVSRVVKAGTALTEAKLLAEEICSNSASAVRLSKKLINTGLRSNGEMEKSSFASCFKEGDAKEGIDAFLSKRKPDFHGR